MTVKDSRQDLKQTRVDIFEIFLVVVCALECVASKGDNSDQPKIVT